MGKYCSCQSRLLAKTLLYVVYKRGRRAVNTKSPDYVDKFDADFTKQGVKQITWGMKNNKATGCDKTMADVQEVLVAKDEGTKTLTKLFKLH
jgi:hypothetical protein